MSNVLVDDSYLEDIADSIRNKNGSQDTYTPSQMSAAIDSLPTSSITSVTSVTINTYSGTTQTRYLRPDGSEGKTDLALSATVLPANATIPDVKWESSDPTKATIVYDEATDTYKLHAVSAGTVTITATSIESGESDTFTAVVATPTLAIIQSQIQAGTILDIMDIGDVVPTTVNFARSATQSTSYDTGIRLVHILDDATKQAKYGLSSYAAIFQYEHATIQNMVFDAPETALEADSTTETTAEEGVYYYGWNSGTTYTPLNLSTGDEIPYADYAKVYKSAINCSTSALYNQIRQQGYNNYKDSAIRQWLNSDAAAGSQGWWTAKHLGDVAPAASYLNYAGWLADIDQDLRAIISTVSIKVAANTVTDGGSTETITDKFFLPSKEEVFANPQASGVEGEVWDYYKAKTGYSSANDNNTPARMISQYPTTNTPYNPVYWWLRSAYRGGASTAWCANTNGYMGSISASISCYVAPACIIS